MIILASVPNWNGGKGEVGTFANNKICQKSCNSQNYIVLTPKNSYNSENSAFTTFFLDVPVIYDFDVYKSPGRGMKFKAKYFFSLPNVLELWEEFFKMGQPKKLKKSAHSSHPTNSISNTTLNLVN